MLINQMSCSLELPTLSQHKYSWLLQKLHLSTITLLFLYGLLYKAFIHAQRSGHAIAGRPLFLLPLCEKCAKSTHDGRWEP